MLTIQVHMKRSAKPYRSVMSSIVYDMTQQINIIKNR